MEKALLVGNQHSVGHPSVFGKAQSVQTEYLLSTYRGYRTLHYRASKAHRTYTVLCNGEEKKPTKELQTSNLTNCELPTVQTFPTWEDASSSPQDSVGSRDSAGEEGTGTTITQSRLRMDLGKATRR